LSSTSSPAIYLCNNEVEEERQQLTRLRQIKQFNPNGSVTIDAFLIHPYYALEVRNKKNSGAVDA
jgi:hypothetical protein